MKYYTACLLLLSLAFGLPETGWSNDHKADLETIIGGFSRTDPAEQYEARRELSQYVADATAPDQKKGAERLTTDLLKWLNDKRTPYEAKKYIVRDLARVGTSEAVAPLGRLMTGKDTLLAESARQALERIQGKEASAILKKTIAKTKDPETRGTYIRTLANRGEKTNADYFAEGLNSGDPVWAVESARALARLGDAKSVKLLSSAYAEAAGELKEVLETELLRLDDTADELVLSIHHDPAVASNRQASLIRLIEAEHPASGELLGAAISGDDSALRATAIRLALEHGNPSLIKDRIETFSNDDWRIVLNGLSAFEGWGAEDLALKAAKERDDEIKALALRVLAEFGTDWSVDLLLEHFSGRDKTLKQAAAYAIERMRVGEMDVRIRKLLNSPSVDDTALAIELLAHRHLPNAKNRLFRFVNGDDNRLAREALKTLSSTADEEDLYRLLFLARRTGNAELKTMIAGMLGKVASEIGSLELQRKAAAL